MRTSAIPILLAIGLLQTAHAAAGFRPLLIEAEHFAHIGQGWMAVTNAGGGPSGGAELRAGGAGTVCRHTINLPEGGRYQVWIRFREPGPSGGRFKLALLQAEPLLQAEVAVAGREFTGAGAAGMSEAGGRQLSWDSAAAELTAGACALELSAPADEVPAIVDCIVVAAEPFAAPDLSKIVRPLYLRVSMAADQPESGVFKLNGLRANMRGGLVPSQIVSAAGLTPGARPGSRQTFLKPGDRTSWMDVSDLLSEKEVNHLQFSAVRDVRAPLSALHCTFELSQAASENGIARSFTRTGAGNEFLIVVDRNAPQDARSDLELSRETLAAARGLPDVPGRRPRRFPILTACSTSMDEAPEVCRNDLETLRRLGLSALLGGRYGRDTLATNGFRMAGAHYVARYARDECFSDIDVEGLRNGLNASLDALLKQVDAADLLYLKLMDEPKSSSLAHIAACPRCADGFRAFLKAQGLTPDIFGLKTWETVAPTTDPAAARLYYYTSLYRCRILMDLFATATQAAQARVPGLKTTSVAAGHLTFDNSLLHGGTDWIAMHRQNALTFATMGDWLNRTVSYETLGYAMAFMRAGCRHNDQDYEVCNVVRAGRSPWDIQCKGFAEVGLGARGLYLYKYGPYHSLTGDHFSRKLHIFPAIRQLTHAIGAVEDHLLQARPVPSRVALLYSPTTDIWESGEKNNLFGLERQHLYLLLHHLGWSPEIVSEDDVLEGAASRYAVIVLNDSHLREGVMPRLLKWVDDGGRLFVGPGSATRDVFNAECDGLAAAGLRRKPFVRQENPSSIAAVPALKVLKTVAAGPAALDVVCGYQPADREASGPALRVLDEQALTAILDRGAGRIVHVGFFPGTAYARLGMLGRDARNAAMAEAHRTPVTYGPSGYPAEYRQFLARLLEGIGASPPVRTDQYLVQADLLAGTDSHVVALANWSGAEQDVRVSVDLPGPAGKPWAIPFALRDVELTGRTLSFVVPKLGPGGFVVLPAERN